MSKEMIQRRTLFESNEAEAFATSRLAIDHDSSVDDASVLREILLQRFGGDSWGKTANEEFLGTLMLQARNGTFWVDLGLIDERQVRETTGGRWRVMTVRTILPSRKCSRTITLLTDEGSLKVKNAKPRERPAPSRMIVQASTSPNFEK